MYQRFEKKSILKILFVIALLCSQFGLYAQSNKKVEDLLSSAKKQFATQNFTGAVKIGNQVLSLESESKEAHLLMAEAYGRMDSVNQEILHLNKAGAIGNDWDVVFKLGEAYYKKGDYSEALRYYNIYSDFPYIPEKRQFLLACKIASCKFLIHSENNKDDYWPVPSSDGKNLVFVSQSQEEGQFSNEDFNKIVPDSVIWKIIKSSSDTIPFDNEDIHKLSDDSKILFFTACDRPEGKGSCDIYFIKFENGKWGTPINAGNTINSEYWEAQPSFSPGNRLLYFSSERNGGKGKKDIWRTELLGFEENGNPRWRVPVNMGNKVNTFGNETSPFIQVINNHLYFVSDALPGLGGKDMFVAELNEVGNAVNAQNLGYPINTIFDDDALTFCTISDTTYFTSSRLTEKGQQIYAFNFDRGLAAQSVSYVKVRIKDAKTKQPVATNVKVEFQPFQHNRFEMQETNDKGESVFVLRLNRNYAFTISEPGYLFASKFLNQSEINTVADPTVLEIELQPIEIGAEVQLYNIYFETDSFRILPESDQELQKVAEFLKSNTNLKIEVQGHTDSSGNAEYNKQLSERRAKSVVDYLVRSGITTTQLKYNGYGDKIPIANNETPEGRMLNRRTTIKIIEK